MKRGGGGGGEVMEICDQLWNFNILSPDFLKQSCALFADIKKINIGLES